MKRLILVLTLLCPLTAFGQTATVFNGNELIKKCGTSVRILDTSPAEETGTEFQEVSFCQGIVHGVSGTLQADGRIDLPQDATLGQLIRVVDKYLRDHPEKLSEHDTILVIAALKKAFPMRAK